MKVYVFIISSVLCCASLFSQQRVNVQSSAYARYEVGLQGIGPDFGNNPASENFYNQMRDKFAGMGIDGKVKLEDIDGSIYLNENFVLGKVLFETTEERGMFMRYNAFNDEFEIKSTESGDDRVLALLKDSKISCELYGQKYMYVKLEGKDDVVSQGYVKMIYEAGPYKLFERTRKIFKEGKAAKTSHAISFPHRFVHEMEYYFMSGDNDVLKYVGKKKKEVIALFQQEHQDSIKWFLNEKKLDLKDRDGLINLMAYSGSL